jgi:hypothetical protein
MDLAWNTTQVVLHGLGDGGKNNVLPRLWETKTEGSRSRFPLNLAHVGSRLL